MKYIKVPQKIAKMVWEKTDEAYFKHKLDNNGGSPNPIDTKEQRKTIYPTHQWNSIEYNKCNWYITENQLNYISKIEQLFYDI